MMEGSTDTEHMAALYMTYLCPEGRKDFHGAGGHYLAKKMKEALKMAILKVWEIQVNNGFREPNNYYNTCASTYSSSITSHFTHDDLS
jgi:hypothetical protein